MASAIRGQEYISHHRREKHKKSKGDYHSQNCIDSGVRTIPGLALGEVSGKCWERNTRLQVSYDNLLEYIYKLCEIVGGSINIRNDGNALVCELYQGVDRSILQNDNPHIVFSDDYNNLLSFAYAADDSIQKKIQLVGMIESFDSNGKSLTPTFKEG